MSESVIFECKLGILGWACVRSSTVLQGLSIHTPERQHILKGSLVPPPPSVGRRTLAERDLVPAVTTAARAHLPTSPLAFLCSHTPRTIATMPPARLPATQVPDGRPPVAADAVAVGSFAIE